MQTLTRTCSIDKTYRNKCFYSDCNSADSSRHYTRYGKLKPFEVTEPRISEVQKRIQPKWVTNLIADHWWRHVKHVQPRKPLEQAIFHHSEILHVSQSWHWEIIAKSKSEPQWRVLFRALVPFGTNNWKRRYLLCHVPKIISHISSGIYLLQQTCCRPCFVIVRWCFFIVRLPRESIDDWSHFHLCTLGTNLYTTIS